MDFDIITIFPGVFDSYFKESIIKRAQERKKIRIKIHNLRDFSSGRHRKVDDRQFGGGPGMVMYAEPIVKAVEFAKSKSRSKPAGRLTKVVLFAPGGKQFDDKAAHKLAKESQIIMVCGHYEGVDERVEKTLKDLKIKTEKYSIGPYVLTGGELAAMVLVDSVSRKIPGVLGKEESLEEKRLGIGVPVYTRPAVFKHKGKKYEVPKILLSGDHKKIEDWRKKHKEV